MKRKLQTILGFPYPPEFEDGYRKRQVLQMYKPLLIVVLTILMLMIVLVSFCYYAPDMIAPPEYLSTLTFIHVSFLGYTFLALCLAVLLRRLLLDKPRVYFVLCNGYAFGICLWSSAIAAYANYSYLVFTAYIYVSLCVSLVSQFKPWQALLVFSGHYLFYALLQLIVWPSPQLLDGRLANAGLAALLSIVIATAFFRFRTRTYYDHTVISQQVDEIHRINSRLQELVHIDELTGLYNRRYFDEMLPGQLIQFARGGMVFGMMLDVDHFKDYNDRYGHQAGDRCLRHIARVLRENTESLTACPVRYGGEEFFILATAASEDDARGVAENLRSQVEQLYIEHLAAPSGKVTLSIGVAFLVGNAETVPLGALTQKADQALYRAKAAGRNCVVFDPWAYRPKTGVPPTDGD